MLLILMSSMKMNEDGKVLFACLLVCVAVCLGRSTLPSNTSSALNTTLEVYHGDNFTHDCPTRYLQGTTSDEFYVVINSDGWALSSPDSDPEQCTHGCQECTPNNTLCQLIGSASTTDGEYFCTSSKRGKIERIQLKRVATTKPAPVSPRHVTSTSPSRQARPTKTPTEETLPGSATVEPRRGKYASFSVMIVPVLALIWWLCCHKSSGNPEDAADIGSGNMNKGIQADESEMIPMTEECQSTELVVVHPLPGSVLISMNDLAVYLEDGESAVYYIKCNDERCSNRLLCQNPYTSPRTFDNATTMPIVCPGLKENHVYTLIVDVGTVTKVKKFTTNGSKKRRCAS